MNRLPHSAEEGAASVEFAVTAIVLFTLIFGVVAVAMAFYTYEVLNQYARDASRYAMVHGSGCSSPINGTCSIGVGDNFAPNGTPSGGAPADVELKKYLNNQIFPGINGANLVLTTAYTTAPGASQCTVSSCNGAGDQVTVTVSYPYLYVVPFVPQNSFTMHASSTMVISQ